MRSKGRILIALFTFLSLSVMAQEVSNNTALLVIDIQEFYFPGGDMALSGPEKATSNTLELIKYFRDNGRPVIYVRHNYEPGGKIYETIKPDKGDMVFSKDKANAFLGTGLGEYLKDTGIESLVICGMQTHMCVEAATRAASDMGYNCILIHDACATRDLKFNDKVVKAEDVHASTLSTLRSYAKIMSTEEFISR